MSRLTVPRKKSEQLRQTSTTKILYLYANVIYMTLNVSWLVMHDFAPFFQRARGYENESYDLGIKVSFSWRRVSCVSIRL